MCHKAIRCWISQFKRGVYLASCFRATKTRKEQQTSHRPGCSRPVPGGRSSSALLPLLQEQSVHSPAGTFCFHHLQQAGLWAFFGVCHSLLESTPPEIYLQGDWQVPARPPGFVLLEKKTITHLSNLSQMI